MQGINMKKYLRQLESYSLYMNVSLKEAHFIHWCVKGHLIPDEWEDGDTSRPAKVNGHEGRHRMHAVKDVDGDVPVEVHIWGKFERSEMRRRHLTDEMIKEILKGLIDEKGDAYITDIGT